MPPLRRLLIATLIAAPCTAEAQFSSPPGVPIPTIVLVRSSEGVTATNALVRLLGYDVERYTDSDGRAVLPALPRGDFLILLQSTTDGSSLRGVSANGVADTLQLRLARRVPSIDTYGTTNVLTEPLAAAAQRRFRRLGGVLAGAPAAALSNHRGCGAVPLGRVRPATRRVCAHWLAGRGSVRQRPAARG